MAVYTKLSKEDVDEFLAGYNVVELNEYHGLADGVSNTNYLLHTKDYKRYILTIFEQNSAGELPFFMELTEYLADKKIPCPRPIHNNSGKIIGEIKGKPAALIEFLRRTDNLANITIQHIELLGEIIAKLHLAAKDFPQECPNNFSIAGLRKLFSNYSGQANKIADGLENEIVTELDFLEKNFPPNLPKGIIHADIFPDNVFFITNPLQVSGIIDFYCSCSGFWMYDLMIVINAWCFDNEHHFMPEMANALLKSYNKIRPISEAEIAAMKILGRAAAMRFLISRAYDKLNQVEGAMVAIKDPLEYVEKLKFWQETDWKYE